MHPSIDHTPCTIELHCKGCWLVHFQPRFLHRPQKMIRVLEAGAEAVLSGSSLQPDTAFSVSPVPGPHLPGPTTACQPSLQGGKRRQRPVCKPVPLTVTKCASSYAEYHRGQGLICPCPAEEAEARHYAKQAWWQRSKSLTVLYSLRAPQSSEWKPKYAGLAQSASRRWWAKRED
jgi:hypothetical protein